MFFRESHLKVIVSRPESWRVMLFSNKTPFGRGTKSIRICSIGHWSLAVEFVLSKVVSWRPLSPPPTSLHFALQSLVEVETRFKQALININIVWIILWHLFALRVHEDQIRTVTWVEININSLFSVSLLDFILPKKVHFSLFPHSYSISFDDSLTSSSAFSFFLPP